MARAAVRAVELREKHGYTARWAVLPLAPYNGRVYAIARYQATHARRYVELGGMYSRKRTSLFLVEDSGLRYLTDLPSSGDTWYAGVVAIQGVELYASYYTSPPEHDITWVMGMFRPSHIRMARIDLPALERLALATPPPVAATA